MLYHFNHCVELLDGLGMALDGNEKLVGVDPQELLHMLATTHVYLDISSFELAKYSSR